MEKTCGLKCEVYSRVVGYFRPLSNWNHGKKEEFKDRKTFNHFTRGNINGTNINDPKSFKASVYLNNKLKGN
jgi:ribonucleoside-triphosphate reductase